MKSYKTAKENFSMANNALKETKVMMTNMKDKISELERNSGHKDATIAGFKLRIEEGSRNEPNEDNLEELLETKEKLLEEKLEELATYKAKSEVLGTELSTAKRHLYTNAKATAFSRSEFQRLSKVEAAYSKVMDDHFGGQAGKMESLMRTTRLMEDCSDTVKERWLRLNSFKFDEESMTQLTLLLGSKLLLKSRKLLVDFLQSSLKGTNVHDNDSNNVKIATWNNVTVAAPKKAETQIENMRTPENFRRKRPAKNQTPQGAKRNLSFHSPSNKRCVLSWEDFPDLAELEVNKSQAKLAEIDLSVFEQHRTGDNSSAKVVRTEAGAYIAMSSNMSNRRYCHEHKHPDIKGCERPHCVRLIFPHSHHEGETIGRVVFYQGIMKIPQKGKAIQREGNVLYVCKLCLYRSQNTYLARQFITDLQEDQACLKAEEDASNNADNDVIGIATVDISAMKVKATRTEHNASRSRTLVTPNAGKTDEAAYKSIIGTISAPAQKHALSSKTLNNIPSLVLKQKTPTFKQQKPLQLTPRPQLQEQARGASSRA